MPRLLTEAAALSHGRRKQKIWLYRDKETGALKGDGTITYEDPFSAGSAVEWFNNKEWKGRSLQARV